MQFPYIHGHTLSTRWRRFTFLRIQRNRPHGPGHEGWAVKGLFGIIRHQSENKFVGLLALRTGLTPVAHRAVPPASNLLSNPQPFPVFRDSLFKSDRPSLDPSQQIHPEPIIATFEPNCTNFLTQILIKFYL